jgi:two-component system, chemotaxis family, chemotaxis protein CheY
MSATILVLEDEELMRELLRMHLSNAGYEVLVAEDAVVAGRLLMTQLPDLIVSDIEMPFMDGLELVELLKADGVAANIPVIFVSSRSDLEDRCMELGAVAFLQKPVLADRLLALVGEHVPGGLVPL